MLVAVGEICQFLLLVRPLKLISFRSLYALLYSFLHSTISIVLVDLFVPHPWPSVTNL